MPESEEIKEIGDVKCPRCGVLVTVKKKVTYDAPEPRHKVSEELFAEESIQTTLDLTETIRKK